MDVLVVHHVDGKVILGEAGGVGADGEVGEHVHEDFGTVIEPTRDRVVVGEYIQIFVRFKYGGDAVGNVDLVLFSSCKGRWCMGDRLVEADHNLREISREAEWLQKWSLVQLFAVDHDLHSVYPWVPQMNSTWSAWRCETLEREGAAPS